MKKTIYTKGTYAGVLEGDIPEATVDVPPPTVKWVGKKIAFPWWSALMHFFVDQKDHEVCVYMVYSETSGVEFYVPEQEVSGGSVRITDNGDKDLAALLADHVLLGNIHTHPSFGAFDSGVDKAQEAPTDGVYITVGKVTEKVAEYHIRCYIKGHKYEDMPNLMGLVEVPTIAGFDHFGELAIMQTIYFPYAYPKGWKEKIKIPSPVVNYGSVMSSLAGMDDYLTPLGRRSDGFPEVKWYEGEARLSKKQRKKIRRETQDPYYHSENPRQSELGQLFEGV